MSPLDVPPAPLPGGTLAELPMLRPCAKLGILANEGIWVVPHLERIWEQNPWIIRYGRVVIVAHRHGPKDVPYSTKEAKLKRKAWSQRPNFASFFLFVLIPIECRLRGTDLSCSWNWKLKSYVIPSVIWCLFPGVHLECKVEVCLCDWGDSSKLTPRRLPPCDGRDGCYGCRGLKRSQGDFSCAIAVHALRLRKSQIDGFLPDSPLKL